MTQTGHRVIYGLRTDAELYEADVEGSGDPGTTPATIARTNRLAPAGPRGECIFTRLALTFQYDGGAHVVYVTPIIDEERAQDAPAADGRYIQRKTLTLPAVTSRTVLTVEVPIMAVYRRGGVDRLRNSPRGRWIQVELEMTLGTTIIIDSCDVEYEIVRETQRPQ